MIGLLGGMDTRVGEQLGYINHLKRADPGEHNKQPARYGVKFLARANSITPSL